jgi:hypothetical protein
MNLSDQILGIHEKDTLMDAFEWRGSAPAAKNVSLPDGLIA